jgi:hypothetical protein
MKATIYIPDDQSKIYEDAKEKLGDSISKTFLRCLERELENAKLRTGRIVVEIHDVDTGRVSKKAFEGRFIVGDESSPEEFRFSGGEGITHSRGHGGYAVASTKANRIVVLEFDSDNNVTDMSVHDNYDDFAGAQVDGGYPQYPETLIQAVAAELEFDRIEDLDI